MKKIGILILALGLVLGFSSCKTETEEVTLEKIEITAQLSKTEYFVGEELDTTGLEVTAIYSDKSTKVVTDWTTTGYDKEKAGEQTVEVSYSENEITKTANFTVTVKEKKAEPGKEPGNEPPKVELTKIEITAQPSKTEYFVGEELNTTGLEVTAIYSDESSKVVTGWTPTGYDKTKAGKQTVTVSYTETGVTAKTSYTVTVKEVPVKPENPGKDPAKVELTKIEVTTPADKVVYLVGEDLDTTGLEITATYSDESSKVVTGWTPSGYDKTKVGEQSVKITYTENEITVETSYTVTVKVTFNWYETPVQLSDDIGGTYGTEGTYVLFGVWPQDVVPEADVEVLNLNEEATTTIERGYLKFVFGSDGNYYVKCKEHICDLSNTYTKYTKDGSAVGTSSRWFKVMPIKWRVVDPAYDVDGTNGSSTAKLLVAENILTANVPYYNYGDSERTRTVELKNKIYPNNYEFSQIRAYLNGLDYYYDTNNGTTSTNKYKEKGFLQTAFTVEAAAKILTTRVDNSEESTTEKDGVITKATDYACGPTEDKIFLLSEYEVIKYSKSEESVYEYGEGNSRIRITTDFAKANYAYQDTNNDFGGYYWLRSPSASANYDVCSVGEDGYAYRNFNVKSPEYGVVPALSISF